MSALTQPHPRPVGDWRRPSLWGLGWSVFAGEVQAAIVLWAIAIVLSLLALAPIGGAQQWLWLPWRIDGAWALVGAVGWGYLVCACVGRFVAGSLERRGFERPAAGWMLIAIAISGYGGMALGHTVGQRVFWAVVLGAITVRLLAFDADGSARGWRWSPRRRLQVAGVVAALLAGLSYGVTHAFAADGSGGASGTTLVHVGQAQTIEVGLNHMRFPVEVQSATLTGPGATHVRIRSVVLNSGSPQDITPAWQLPMIPRADRRFMTVTSTHLPYRVSAGQDLWISTRVALGSCHAATLNTLRLRYTVLGIPTTASIPIQSPLTLACSR